MGSKKKVFVVWDSKTHRIKTALETLVDDEHDDFEFFVPTISEGTSGLIWGHVVRPRIEQADEVVAFVDLPNANVGFEIGYALAKRKNTRLLWSGDEPPRWTKRAPFQTYLLGKAENSEQILAHLRGRLGPTPIPKPPRFGEDIYFLCPSDARAEDVHKRVLAKSRPHFRRAELAHWTFDEIERVFPAVGQLVWTLLRFDPARDERDGQENAAAAAVAGFLHGHGTKLHVWQEVWEDGPQREIVDLGAQPQAWTKLADLDELVAKVLSLGTCVPIDPLARYRAFLGRHHKHLVPFFAGEKSKALVEAYVEILAAPTEPRLRGTLHGTFWDTRPTPESLWNLLIQQRAPEYGITGAWTLVGKPGSGKSTVCRRVCQRASENSDGPLPIFVSLSRWAREDVDPFVLAERDLAATPEDKFTSGVADALREAAKHTDDVWILFDGLDEAPNAKTIARRIQTFLETWPRCKVVVTTRPEAKQDLGPSFREAQLQALGAERQRELLRAWLGDDADALWQRIQSRPALIEDAANPLMLTIMARVAQEPGEFPSRRAALYERALSTLLTRGFGEDPKPVASPDAAKLILPELALRLHEEQREDWTRDEVYAAVTALEASDPKRWEPLFREFGTRSAFLDDLSHNSGVLAPQGGPNDRWRFMHKSFREYLAAKALFERGVDEYLARAKALVVDEEEVRETKRGKRRRKRAEAKALPIGHWGETFALLTGLVTSPVDRSQLFTALRHAGRGVLVRTLTQIEGLDPAECLDLLIDLGEDEWDGNVLSRLLATWLVEDHTADTLKALVLERATKKRSTTELAYLLYGAEHAGLRIGRQVFFERCGRWRGDVPVDVPMKRVPPEGASVTFMMGSREGPGSDDERPRHEVALKPFRLASTPITQKQYALFGGTRPSKEPNLPVVEVSWWEAWLFCRWLADDARLPSEAEWECACRAGSETEYSFGDDSNELRHHAWYFVNSGKAELPPNTGWDYAKVDVEWGCRVRPVGEKHANEWGLLDMHGNVWEWCEDTWHDDYTGAPKDGTAWVDLASEFRVVRGGSFRVTAGVARSAIRFRIPPSSRWDLVGFRPARSVSTD